MCTAIIEWFNGLGSQGIGNLITFLTAIVAIIGLIYQSMATRKQVKLQNFIEYTKRYQEIILNFPENINAQDFTFEDIDTNKERNKERNKTMRYMRAYLDLCFEEYTLHDKGFIDNDLWSIWKGGMETAFTKPAFKQAWEIIKKDTEYGVEFNHFANQLGLKR